MTDKQFFKEAKKAIRKYLYEKDGAEFTGKLYLQAIDVTRCYNYITAVFSSSSASLEDYSFDVTYDGRKREIYVVGYKCEGCISYTIRDKEYDKLKREVGGLVDVFKRIPLEIDTESVGEEDGDIHLFKYFSDNESL